MCHGRTRRPRGQKDHFSTYQDGVAVIMGLDVRDGAVRSRGDQLSFTFIVADLHLTNVQLGLAAAVFPCLGAGRFSGRPPPPMLQGGRKPYLIAAVIAFSLCFGRERLVGALPCWSSSAWPWVWRRPVPP